MAFEQKNILGKYIFAIFARPLRSLRLKALNRKGREVIHCDFS
jgi:hypothetical protein